MRYLKSLVVLAIATIGTLPGALAGVEGVVTTTVEALSGTVTYSTTGAKPLNTKVGYRVTIIRTGTNTVNNVVFSGDTSVVTTNPVGTNTGEFADYLEANDDDGACGVGTAITKVVCNLGQMRPGDKKTFAVFFKGPVESAGNCFTAGGPSCEAVRFTGATNYSEGTNDSSGSAPNDQSAWSVVDVPLGTANPTNVKSALSKTGDNTIFTGVDGAPSLTTFPFATQLRAPNPPAFGSATITLKKLLDNDQTTLCDHAGNFTTCYEAGIDVPGVVYTYMPGSTNYLTTLLRINSSEVISPFRASRVKVYYKEFPTDPEPVNSLPFCPADGVPLASAPHCVVNNIFRYSNSGNNGELRGDVQIEVHGLRNGLLRTR